MVISFFKLKYQYCHQPPVVHIKTLGVTYQKEQTHKP